MLRAALYLSANRKFERSDLGVSVYQYIRASCAITPANSVAQLIARAMIVVSRRLPGGGEVAGGAITRRAIEGADARLKVRPIELRSYRLKVRSVRTNFVRVCLQVAVLAVKSVRRVVEVWMATSRREIRKKSVSLPRRLQGREELWRDPLPGSNRSTGKSRSSAGKKSPIRSLALHRYAGASSLSLREGQSRRANMVDGLAGHGTHQGPGVGVVFLGD